MLEPIDLVVDLFPTLPVPTYAVKAFELMRSMTLARIAKELGESKRNAHRAAQLGKRMHELKVTDPFVRLTEPPEKLPARWRFNRTAPPKDTWSDGKNGQPPVT